MYNMTYITLTDTNSTCPLILLWNKSTINTRQPILYICLIGIITHFIFWLQVILYPSIQNKTMQWIYAYVFINTLQIIRFIFIYIVRTRSYTCTPNRMWFLFICYIEGAVDDYLEILEGYILFILNFCRYAQIVWNKNVYITNKRLLIFIHTSIYLMPLICFIIQICVGWAHLNVYPGEACDVLYINIHTQIFNIIIIFFLPIIFNILLIYASIRHIHLISQLRRSQHHVSAREKYHRSLVIQFLVFYLIWLFIWSLNIFGDQFTNGTSNLILIGSLLNYIQIIIDPLIIGALDVRFWNVWKNLCR